VSTRNSGVFWDSSIVKQIDKIIHCKKIFREITKFRESHMKFMKIVGYNSIKREKREK
jgi:hypothetical protein